MTEAATAEDVSQLDLETMDVLRGAGELKGRLLLEMSTGSPAISDMAYAVKVRIKEDYKIVEKVVRKRVTKPEYCVKDLRDVLGLRIVTLYRLDALKIIPVLLDKIQTTSTDPHALFVPNKLEEVVVYSTNPKGDPQGLVSRIQEVFSSRGLKAIVRIEDTPSNYTSIHMVTWCRGKYRGGYRTIPVEIQVRTALEDVWSEIDHSLKYKRELTDRKGSLDAFDEGRLQSSLSHLNVMKTLVDGIAQYADQIKIQLDEVDDHRERSLHSRQGEDSLSLLEPLPEIPRELKVAIVAAVRRSNEVISSRGDGQTPSQKRAELRRVLTDFDALRVDLQLAGNLPPQTALMVNYIVEAERALVLFEIGNGLEGGTPLLADASKAYADLQTHFPERGILKYRHAKVLDAMGDRDTAIALLSAAIPQIDTDDSLPAGHWLRFAPRRVLGVLLGERGSTLSRNLSAGSWPAARSEDVLHAYWEACRVTMEVYEKIEQLADPEDANAHAERVKAANNLVWFALEFFDAGGSAAQLDHRFTADLIDQLLGEMQTGELAEQEDQRVLDTARRAYEHIGATEKARAAAQKIIENYRSGKAERGPQQDEDMARAAHATLERYSTTEA